MIYKITPLADCRYCHGSGIVYDIVPYGSTTASMPSDCGCIWEQVPYFNDDEDDIEIVQLQIIARDGPEFDAR